MRETIKTQMEFGEVDIASIEIDVRSRDEIPKLLRGLQHIYTNIDIRKKIFSVLEMIIPKEVDRNNGRFGMSLWEILVLGTIRLNCNWDYDKLYEIANNHMTLREMLGISRYSRKKKYGLSTLRDNIGLFTPEVLKKINVIVVECGHNLIKKKDEELKFSGRCDSFVVETNVHYPTDINLLFDAMRKTIILTSRLCLSYQIEGWRQFRQLLKRGKKLFRIAQKATEAHRRSKNIKREKKWKKAYKSYTVYSEDILNRAEESLKYIITEKPKDLLLIEEIRKFIAHGRRQIDQARRRVLNNEVIPHNEKIFSIFEEHTEWISKGKAGIPQELGLRVCVLEDQFGFILSHRVMQKEEDSNVATLIVKDTKKNFHNLTVCSFDKGFWSPENKNALEKILEKVIMPKKGKLSLVEKEIESTEEFRELRGKHAAVESAINALENHGLDRCPDHGLNGFKRYVALSVLSRNIQIIGHILQQAELQELQKAERKKSA